MTKFAGFFFFILVSSPFSRSRRARRKKIERTWPETKESIVATRLQWTLLTISFLLITVLFQFYDVDIWNFIYVHKMCVKEGGWGWRRRRLKMPTAYSTYSARERNREFYTVYNIHTIYIPVCIQAMCIMSNLFLCADINFPIFTILIIFILGNSFFRMLLSILFLRIHNIYNSEYEAYR